MNSTTCSSGGLITVRLPMALVDLNSFAMHFATNVTDAQVLTDGTNTAARGLLPKGIEGLISRLEVSVNGLGLLNLQQYHLLYSVMKESHMDMDKSMSRRVLQNEVDTAPILNAETGTTLGTAVPVPFTLANYTVSTAGTAATIVGYTPCVYPNLYLDTSVYGFPALPSLGLVPTGGVTNAYGTVTAIAVVPAYTSVVNSVTINGPLVQKVTITLAAGTSWAYTAPTVQVPLTLIAGVDTPSNASMIANQNNFHSIHDWLSFFKAQPNWIQLQMLGEVEIRITLQDNSVLGIAPPVLSTGSLASTASTVTTRPDFSLYGIYFTVRTCSFDNNFVDELLHSKLASGGEIEIPYPNAYNINQVQSSGASSTRFSVNTQSLDKVIGVNRPSYYNSTAGACVQVPVGFGVSNMNQIGLVNKSPFFQTYAANPAGANFNGGVVVPNTWQYQINNAFIPNVRIDPSITYFTNLEAMGFHNDWLSSTIAGGPGIYLNSSYQMAIDLNFQDASIPRLVSGIDTRGAVSVAYLNQDNNNLGDRTDVFCLFTSILRVGANQQIQVIY